MSATTLMMTSTARRVKPRHSETETHYTKTIFVSACDYLDGEGVGCVMSIYASDEQVQEGCCRALSDSLEKFVSNSSSHRQIGEWLRRMSNRIGSADMMVVEAMQSFPENKYIQMHGCTIIFNLASLAPSTTYFIQLGACSAVSAAMHAFRNEEVIQSRGVDAISAMVVDNNKCWRTLIDVEDVCDALIGAMAGFGTSEGKHLRGLIALTRVLGRQFHNTERVMRLGVCETVIAAMRMFPGNKDIQCYALESVQVLGNGEAVAITTFVPGGIIDLLLTAMRTYPFVYAIQTAGVYTLMRIVEQTETDLVSLVNKGLGEVVFAATNCHLHCEYRIKDVCNIVTQVLLAGRIPKEVAAKFKPRGGGSVYDAMETLRDKIRHLENYGEKARDSMCRYIDNVSERLWNQDLEARYNSI